MVSYQLTIDKLNHITLTKIKDDNVEIIGALKIPCDEQNLYYCINTLTELLKRDIKSDVNTKYWNYNDYRKNELEYGE